VARYWESGEKAKVQASTERKKEKIIPRKDLTLNLKNQLLPNDTFIKLEKLSPIQKICCKDANSLHLRAS
jgi:hypothetical protein